MGIASFLANRVELVEEQHTLARADVVEELP
jgi:hypothetical protein